METEAAEPYPGALTRPEAIFSLATMYHVAAETIFGACQPRDRLAQAPARLCAIHAIELYLTAYLRTTGETAERLRACQHNLVERGEMAAATGLVLRRRTFNHLSQMTDRREYLVSRYDPGQLSMVTQNNRLLATLNEIAGKVKPVVSGEKALSLKVA